MKQNESGLPGQIQSASFNLLEEQDSSVEYQHGWSEREGRKFFLRLSSCLAYWHQAGHLAVIKFSCCHSDIYKSESQYFFISLSYPLFICWRRGWGEERGKKKGERKNGTAKEQNSDYLSSRKFL